MKSAFLGYDLGQRATISWDEMFDDEGIPRAHYGDLHSSLGKLSTIELTHRKAGLDRAFEDAGITFDFDGTERAWPLDLIPRILDVGEWQTIERGVVQRVKALEAFLADVYGAQEVLRAGLLPYEVVTASSHFQKAACGIAPRKGVHVHVAGIDLVRDRDGQFRVLEDNVRVPSGVSYVLENRHAMTKMLPEAFATHRVRPVADYAVQLLESLRDCAPEGVDDPVVVLLTPGVHNSAYFEHTLLARQMGIPLVEGRDLVVQNDRVMMRTTAGASQVDVIYRRVDDEWLDPDEFRPESMLGCAGLMRVARAGRVTIANAVGNGVADDKLVHTYVPELIRYYLGEEPVLANVETYRLLEPDQLEYVLDRLGDLVIKPVDGSGGKGIVIGPFAEEAELERLRQEIVANPRGWVAQPVVALSTAPTLVDGEISPRHIDLRPFAINDGHEIHVLPGGLTRVALPRGGLIVNSSQGGGSKDTWVLAEDAEPAGQDSTWMNRRRPAANGNAKGSAMLSRVAESLYWTGRHLGRAEHTARILDVHLQRIIDDPNVNERHAGRSLLVSMDLAQPEGFDGAVGIEARLGYDIDNPLSVAGAITMSRRNAREAREIISSEFWECLNATWREMPNRILETQRVGPHGFFRYVRQRVAMLMGLMDATLGGDDGRRFVQLGWHIERADMTARLLRSCLSDASPSSSWVSVLRACGSHEAYLRVYRRAADAPSVTEFLLTDRQFPRSVYSALIGVEQLLTELRVQANAYQEPDWLVDMARNCRSGLDSIVVNETDVDLEHELDSLTVACARLSDAVAREVFA